MPATLVLDLDLELGLVWALQEASVVGTKWTTDGGARLAEGLG